MHSTVFLAACVVVYFMHLPAFCFFALLPFGFFLLKILKICKTYAQNLWTGVKSSLIPPDHRSGTSVLGSRTCVWGSGIQVGRSVRICSAVSLLVVTHHDSYKYAFRISFTFRRVAIYVFFVTERCVDVHKLVIVRILFVLADYHNFI